MFCSSVIVCFLLHVSVTGSRISACVRYPYVRSPTSPAENSGAMSPTSMTSHQPDQLDPNANTDTEYQRTMSPVSHDTYYRDASDTIPPYNNNTLKLDNESLIMSQHLNDTKDDYVKDDHTSAVYNEHEHSASANRTSSSGQQYKDNYETTFDLDGNVETKSICSAKSGGSGHDNRYLVIIDTISLTDCCGTHFINYEQTC